MRAIKISSKVDERVWEDLRALAEESHLTVAGLLTEATAGYLHRRRVRPMVLEHLDKSTERNEKLGKLLAR